MMEEIFWINYHKKRVSLRIKARLIFNESLKSWHAEKKHQKAEINILTKDLSHLLKLLLETIRWA